MLWEILIAVALLIALIVLLRIGAKMLKKSRLKPGAIRALAGVLSAVEVIALIYGAFWFLQDSQLFHPGHDPHSWEELAARPEFEAVEFTAGKQTWHGMLRHGASEEPSPLIIFFYGNGQTASQAMRQMDAAGMWGYWGGYSCLVMDYAGYGLNEGRPSAKNMCGEALAAYDYAMALPGVSRVIVGGYSIGTGPAAYLAAHRAVAGLFLLAPYANSYDLYSSVLPIFYGPMRLFVRHRFRSDKCAGETRIPALVVASRDDEIVPFASSKKLVGCFGGECTFIPLNGVGHGSILFDRTALESVKAYLDALAS